MRIIIAADYEQMSDRAAEIVRRRLEKKPDLVLGLIAGNTPAGLYERLVSAHRGQDLSFARVRFFCMDEYLSLPADHPGSHTNFLRRALLDHLDAAPENIFALNGLAPDAAGHCRWYEDQLRKIGGIDLQLLGIGRVGHIGFNEPGSSLSSHTRVKGLNEQTIQDNSRYFGDQSEEVPRFAMTMGVGTILEASEIILMASGRQKAEAIAQTIEGPITNQVTASMLQIHPRVTTIVDREAAACLEHVDYYRYIEEQNRHQKRTGP